MSEFTMILFCCFVISMGCFFGGEKESQVFVNLATVYSCCPTTARTTPRNSFESTRVIALWSSIPLALSPSASAKILFSHVQCVVINVISFFVWITVKHCSVHENTFYRTVRFVSSSVKAFSALVPAGVPIPLRKPLKVFSVNNGVLSLRKWNQAVRLVERLGYCMSLHAVLEHWSTSNGLLLPAAILL